MRGGYLLAEESPEKLLAQFNTDTLEDVFLKLSVIQNLGRCRRSSIAQEVTSAISVPSGVINEAVVIEDVSSADNGEISGEFGDNISLSSRGARRVSLVPPGDVENTAESEIPPEDIRPAKASDYLLVLKSNHMKALIWKNFLWMIRNRVMMFFITLLPVAQIVLFCASIGHDPTFLKIAVVNYESPNFSDCEKVMACNSTQLGCFYLNYLEQRSLELVSGDFFLLI